MDDDLDLRNFSGLCRLFPLPGVVLFPHAVLPLHIFEPRYREMTEDALADDNLVTVVQLRSPTLAKAGGLGSPPIEDVACLGRILQHERLPDGRFNYLLLGRKRVRLHRELPRKKMYRVAEVEVLEDVYGEAPEEPARAELTALFRRAFERKHKLDPDLEALLGTAIPLGVLTDIVSHALGLPPEIKQMLLADPLVDSRVDSLLIILRQMVSSPSGPAGVGRPYPPPFSVN